MPQTGSVRKTDAAFAFGNDDGRMLSVSEARIREVDVQALDAARLEPLIGPERMARYETIAEATQEALAGRAIFNVNSTAAGGGVAEMLQTLLAYGRGAGLDIRWLVIAGDPDFFAITKRIHNGLYGAPGDGGELGESERAHYEAVAQRNAAELRALVQPGDVVLAARSPARRPRRGDGDAGAHVVWRCHVGRDEPNEWTERAWSFLRPYLEGADAFVVSRRAFAPPWCDAARTHVIPPSIDPSRPRTSRCRAETVRLVLAYVGLLAGDGAVRRRSLHPPRRLPRPDQPARRRAADRDHRPPPTCRSSCRSPAGTG